jgi:hypothetical protein
MPDDSSRNRKERIKKYAKFPAVFAAGAVSAALVIRYRNGIGLNELIWAVPVEKLREMVKPGSGYILNTPKGEMFIAKINRGGGFPK